MTTATTDCQGQFLQNRSKQTTLRFNQAIEKRLRDRAGAAGRTLAMEIHLLLGLSLELLDYESERLHRPVDAYEGHSRVQDLRELMVLIDS